jgi:hypothetical protein
MTGPFEDDGLAHFAQEVDQWDPSLDLFFIVANQESPLGDVFPYENSQQAPSPSLSPVPVTPAPPAAFSFDTFPGTTDDSYDNLSAVSDEAASEIPATEPPDGTGDITSPVMSSTEEEHESTTGHKDRIQWPTSHGRVSMGVKYYLTSFLPRFKDAFLYFLHRSRRISSNAFKCGWERCEYSGGFSGIAALLRHIKTKHVCPGLFECPEGHCLRSFNRKDNLVAHMRNVHREIV